MNRMYNFVIMENRIKEIAKKKGKTQAQIADVASVAVITVAKYYSQDRQPSSVTLESIAEVLQCDPLELLKPGINYAHFYDENGIWQGIRRK